MTSQAAVKKRHESTRPLNVLIVDDEASVRTLIKATLRSAAVPCEVSEAADGDGALEMARRTPPDLVFLDIVLPGSSVSGVLVCQELCKKAETKVIVISGKASDAAIEGCLWAGAADSVRKPFSVPELRSKLEEWLSG